MAGNNSRSIAHLDYDSLIVSDVRVTADVDTEVSHTLTRKPVDTVRELLPGE